MIDYTIGTLIRNQVTKALFLIIDKRRQPKIHDEPLECYVLKSLSTGYVHYAIERIVDREYDLVSRAL